MDYQGDGPAWHDETVPEYVDYPQGDHAIVHTAPNHPDHRDLFLLAIRAQDGAFVKSLLAAGTNPNVQDAEGSTALDYAVAFGDKGLVARLIGIKADPNLRDNMGRNAATLALELGQADVLQFLESRGSHVDPAIGGQMLYDLLLFGLTADDAKFLLAHGADPSWTNYVGETALSRAIIFGRRDIVQMLLEHGFDPMKISPNTGFHPGYVALAAAVQNNDLELIKRLLAAGVQVDEKIGSADGSGLAVAIEHGRMDILRLLFDHADKPAPELVVTAAKNKNLEALDLLLARGVDPNFQGSHDATPLMIAAQLGWIDGVQHLLAKGADRHLADTDGKTAADYAASPDIIALLDAPPSVDSQIPAQK
jgi:ankyrin repeat protein